MLESKKRPPTRPLPRWLRLLLMAVLVATVCVAFYLTFESYIAETVQSPE